MLTGIAVFYIHGLADAAINPIINFQGKLTNPDGTNVTDGTYSIRFRIYTDPALDAANPCAANTCEWEETQPAVTVTDGVFNVGLGSVTSLPGGVDFNAGALYLGVKVGADPEMSPRITMTASPFAFNSENLDGLDSANFTQLARGVQIDTSGTDPSIFINKNNAAGSPNIIQLQKAGVDVFHIDNSGNTFMNGGFSQSGGAATMSGNISLGSAAATFTMESGTGATTLFNGATAHTIQIATGAAAQTISIGSATGASSMVLNAGTGDMLLNATNGDVTIQATTAGQVMLKPAAADGNNVVIGAVDTIGNLLVLDTKSNAGDPTGVEGGSYHNSSTSKNRCYEGGIWTDCMANRVLAEDTLGVAANSISLTLAAATDNLRCHLAAKGRTLASYVRLRINNNTGAAAYSWNAIGITAAAPVDWQDSSDNEIQLSGTQTGTVAFSAEVQIDGFTDTNKIVTWNAGGLEAAGTNSNFYSGVGGLFDTTNAVTSVQFQTSAGNFTAGSHAWCEGRNVP